MRKLPLFFFISLLISGCKKFTETPEKKCFIPYVDFVAQHVNPSTLEVSFTIVTSYNGTITSYKWDFGDGTFFSGDTPPPHKYPPPSTSNGSSHYQIKLTVANECGQAFWTQNVTISACLPDTKFSYRYLNDSTVEFTNQTKTSSSASYSWNFGDGTTAPNGLTVFTHVYKEDKPFVVSLKATNSCGENNYSETIAVCRKPEASQTVSAGNCGVVSINASASRNAIKYQWDFGNGVILPAVPTTSPSINYTYPNSGTFTIKLKVFNAAGCDSATTSNSVNISVPSLATNSNWSYTSDDLDFNFNRATITNAVSYKWDFGDGSSSTLQNPVHSFNNPGTYTLKLAAANSCGANYEFNVQINAPYYKTLNNIPATGFQQVLVFSPSVIYFLGTNEKLYRTDTSGNWAAITLPSGLAFNSDTKLYKDLNDNLWMYGRKEVARLNANNTWTTFSSSIDLPKNATVRSMAVDRNGVLWTIVDGELRKANRIINSNLNFSSIGYSETAGRLWVTSLASNVLYNIAETGTSLSSVLPSGIVNGSDGIRIFNGEIYFTTGNGIIRTNSSGNTISSYNNGTTGGMITGRPSGFDFDDHGDLWVLLGGQLYKLPIVNSGNTKNYSFNQDLSNLSSIGVLNLSKTDSDILLAKNSGNGAIKIR